MRAVRIWILPVAIVTEVEVEVEVVVEVVAYYVTATMSSVTGATCSQCSSLKEWRWEGEGGHR